MSKFKLVVEITHKKSNHHSKIAKEIKTHIDTIGCSKVEAREVMYTLIRKYKCGAVINT